MADFEARSISNYVLGATLGSGMSGKVKMCTHTTTGGYVDTLKFNIGRVEAGKKTIMRIFSVSNVHGALGDNGQNYKNIAYILEGRGARIVHGCGAKAE